MDKPVLSEVEGRSASTLHFPRDQIYPEGKTNENTIDVSQPHFRSSGFLWFRECGNGIINRWAKPQEIAMKNNVENKKPVAGE